MDAESDRNSNAEQNGPAFSGIAGMLQRALHERSAAICPSSSDDDEAPEDDDEWDDWRSQKTRKPNWKSPKNKMDSNFSSSYIIFECFKLKSHECQWMTESFFSADTI